MRIAFVGKGGSGKTTLSGLFCRSVALADLPILAIDADINQHLASSLDLPAPTSQSILTLGEALPLIKSSLRGSNARIASTEVMIKTTPPGQGSTLLTFGSPHPLFDQLEQRKGNIRLMTVGGFTEDDLGTQCYHSKTGAVELLLNHLLDGPQEYVVVDMTAGADSFASGLFSKFDLTCLVVEPTTKSLSVHHQYRDYAQKFNTPIKVVANKIETSGDIEFVRKAVGNDLIACFSSSRFVRTSEQGRSSDIVALEPKNIQALNDIRAVLDNQQRDWNSMLEQAHYFHRLNAERWANVALGTDLTVQIDPDFHYQDYLA